jgi:hypothetical protein
MPGQQQGVKDMKTHHSTIVKFTKPVSETFASISRSTNQYFEAKAQRARLDYIIESLSAVDPHILKDMGMEGFDRLPPALQERALLNWSRHSSRI